MPNKKIKYIAFFLIFLVFSLLYQSAFSQLNQNHVLSGFLDFTPNGTQPKLNFPLEGVADCNVCHATQNPNAVENSFLPVSTWEGSMKANAMRDPLFWAAVDVANNDVPGVGDFCLRCHSPAGWLAGNVVKTGNPNNPTINGANGCQLSGSLSQADTVTNDYSGVTCHFCHRQNETGPLGQAQVKRDGIIWVDDESCANGGVTNPASPCRKGPYNYPQGTAQSDIAPHPWQYSTFIKSADFCGSCHNVNSPETSTGFAKTLIDSQGNDTQQAMPIEQTFTEWQNSLFANLIFKNSFADNDITTLPRLTTGQTCQSCHMPLSQSPQARACTDKPQGSRAGELRIHQFAGGNSWMPEVLKNLYGNTLIPNRSNAYDQTIGYALDMLQNHSATIEIINTSVTNQSTNFDVKVTNLTGHKLPTGYPEGRRMWLNISITDANDNLVFESGNYNNLTGVLNQDAQIKVYESQQGIYNSTQHSCEISNNGKEVFHFVLNNCIAKDNRIPPLGFSGGNNVLIQPVGITYPTQGSNQNLVNFDISHYQFIPNASLQMPLTITAKLLYQTTSKEYVEFLKDTASDNNIASENSMCNRNWNEGPANKTRGRFMYEQWQQNGRSTPIVMSSISVDLTAN